MGGRSRFSCACVRFLCLVFSEKAAKIGFELGISFRGNRDDPLDHGRLIFGVFYVFVARNALSGYRMTQ